VLERVYFSNRERIRSAENNVAYAPSLQSMRSGALRETCPELCFAPRWPLVAVCGHCALEDAGLSGFGKVSLCASKVPARRWWRGGGLQSTSVGRYKAARELTGDEMLLFRQGAAVGRTW
jgi:hypothetical protein